jgi:hypothetical protein
MWHKLTARSGGRYLSPVDVVRRLESEFAYVETSEEDARRHVRELIQQLLTIRRAGQVPVDEQYLARLDRIEDRAICVHFGDDLGSDTALLSTPVLPEEPLFFEYSSHAHREATVSLVARCAAALGYDIVEESWQGSFEGCEPHHVPVKVVPQTWWAGM